MVSLRGHAPSVKGEFVLRGHLKTNDPRVPRIAVQAIGKVRSE